MSLQQSDAEAGAVAKAPRVSLADIEAAISNSYMCRGDLLPFAMHVDDDMSLSTLTICIVVMKNGFTIIGKSAPADPANYNKEVGEKFALEDAMRQIWPLMGFALRDTLQRNRASVAPLGC